MHTIANIFNARCACTQVASGEADFSKATFVNPDEWIGLGARHPEAYRSYLERELAFDTNIAVPDGDCADPVSVYMVTW